MYVYMAGVDIEIHLPRAEQVVTTIHDNIEFRDAAGEVVATFPAASVVMFSKERSYRQQPLVNDGQQPLVNDGATDSALR